MIMISLKKNVEQKATLSMIANFMLVCRIVIPARIMLYVKKEEWNVWMELLK